MEYIIGVITSLFSCVILIIVISYILIRFVPEFYRAILRDQFAKTAMLGMLNDGCKKDYTPNEMAFKAYNIADEMILERKKERE